MFAFFIFIVSSLTFAVIEAEYIARSRLEKNTNYCVLPPYPENGRYTVSHNPHETPGDIYSTVSLDISCDTGYLNNNTVKILFCANGVWSASMPTCDRDLSGFCKLSTGDLKVEYRCLSFPGTLERSWECESSVPEGTTVRPICRFPAYFSFNLLPEMHCRHGKWDYNPICQPACGLTTQHQHLEGISGDHLELPWQSVIYKNESGSYDRRCGGSLISATKIISSAHCFTDYDYNLLPASNFVVAVNKMYHPYNDSHDRNSQYAHVIDIKVPSSFLSSALILINDIAIAVIEIPLFFHLSVRPVCLDFDTNLDTITLSEGNSGKTVHWNKADTSNVSSKVKNVVDLQYIKIQDCRNKLSINQRRYLNSDKFCAVYNGAERSREKDFGGGLAFLEPTTQRYYLRGVLSIILGYTLGESVYLHTSIVKHEHFIKQHL